MNADSISAGGLRAVIERRLLRHQESQSSGAGDQRRASKDEHARRRSVPAAAAATFPTSTRWQTPALAMLPTASGCATRSAQSRPTTSAAIRAATSLVITIRALVSTYASIFPTKQLCFTEFGYLVTGQVPLANRFAWAQNTTPELRAAVAGAGGDAGERQRAYSPDDRLQHGCDYQQRRYSRDQLRDCQSNRRLSPPVIALDAALTRLSVLVRVARQTRST